MEPVSETDCASTLLAIRPDPAGAVAADPPADAPRKPTDTLA